MNKEILKAKRSIRRQTQKIFTLVKDSYPQGSIVFFDKGRGSIRGEVLDVYNDRLRVRNTETKKEYWVDLWNLLSASDKGYIYSDD